MGHWSFADLLFNGECKTKEWSFKAGRKKASGPNGQLSKSTKIFKTKEPQREEVAFYLVLWPTLCLFHMAIFEGDASLKWMPAIKA